MKKLFSIILILILSAGMLNNCKKDKGDPPVLPPFKSMTIDFSNFVTPTKSAELKGTENSNWVFAASVAGFWNLLISTTLIVPITSFKLAVDQDPVYLDNKTWQWSYSASVASVIYKARLTGQISSTDVLWKMYISKEGTDAFAEFVWFQGTSKIDGSGGQWILNQSAQTPSAMLQIDWTKTNNSIESITYTYVKNDSFKNSYIEYGLTSGTYDAYYTVHYYNGVKFSDVDIEWNTSTYNGRVKIIDYLADDSWYCWNENLINIECL